MEQPNITPKWPPPTAYDVEAIITFNDSIIRNLKITQAYHELTIGLTALLGQENINWCGQATWASKTAGIFIRNEQVSHTIDFYLKDSPAVKQLLSRFNRIICIFTRKVHLDESFIFTLLERVIDEMSRNVIGGNIIVFQELAPLYVRMYAMFLNSSSYNQLDLYEFLSHLTPGSVNDGGQDYLITAFTHYYEALFETNPKAKAELILLSNLLVGYHEQIRLQEPIVGAMEAPLDEVFEEIFFDSLSSLIQTFTPRFINKVIISLFKRILKAPLKTIAREWREISTRLLMTLEYPHETLELDKDIPSIKSGKMFPPDLTNLENPELISLLNQLDYTANTTKGSAARDWGKLDDRMNFIADLFRSHQQDSTLYEQPFTDAQVDVIHDGRLPEGKL